MLKLGESFEVLVLGVVAGNRHSRSIWLAILYSASRERSITIFVVSFVRRRSIKYIFYLEWYSAYFLCPLSPTVRQLTCNEQIVGSNPTGGSIQLWLKNHSHHLPLCVGELSLTLFDYTVWIRLFHNITSFDKSDTRFCIAFWFLLKKMI